mgnify:CR=1 FL=1
MNSLLILTALLAFSLFAVHQVNRWEARLRQRRLRQHRLRMTLETLEEVLVEVESTLANPDLTRSLNDEILDRLQDLLNLAGSKGNLVQTRLHHAQERQDQMARAGNGPTRFMRESDAQVAHTKACLHKAAEVLRKRGHLGILNSSELGRYLEQLRWAELMVDVVTFLAEGHKTLRRGDIIAALAYYKKAQSLLINSDHPNEARIKIVQELDEVITGKRKDISPNLIPELAEHLEWRPALETPA